MSRSRSSPAPWRQFEAKTTFLRVPASDWLQVKNGYKTEFRATGRAVTQLWNVHCPTPVVAYAVLGTDDRPRHESKLMVLEATWSEPLGEIASRPESLAREGFADFAQFRRYWMIRTHRRFRPLDKCVVYRVRDFTEADRSELGVKLLERLYQEHDPSAS